MFTDVEEIPDTDLDPTSEDVNIACRRDPSVFVKESSHKSKMCLLIV